MKPINLLWALLATLLFATDVHAKTVALVIGVSDYRNVQKLINPVNDAKRAGEVFKTFDFDVTVLTDPKTNQLRQALRDFRHASANADVALIYFAGHGIQVDDQNIFLSADTEVSGLNRFLETSIHLNELTNAFSDTANAKLLFLDACRDNPFEGTAIGARLSDKGLARANVRMEDLLVIYAAQPDRVAYDGDGSNGPFVSAIADVLLSQKVVRMSDAWVDITNRVRTITLDRQQPYIEGSLSVHLEFEQTALRSLILSPVEALCRDPLFRIPFRSEGEAYLEVEAEIASISAEIDPSTALKICPIEGAIRIEAPLPTEFSAEQLMDPERDGIGYYFETPDGRPAHIWFYMNKDDPTATVELGLYLDGQQISWINTAWRLNMQMQTVLSWDWRLDAPPATLPDVDLLGLDVFDTPARLIADGKARGIEFFCYINAGAWENWRPDADQFPPTILGADYEGWPGERWLDVRDIETLAPIMEARLDLCVQKGFVAAEFDNLGGHRNTTGFDLSEADVTKFARWLAAAARERGLAAILKNSSNMMVALEPDFDWLLMESCIRDDFCDAAEPFHQSGKRVLDVEYQEDGMTLEQLCASPHQRRTSAILKTYELNDWVATCS